MTLDLPVTGRMAEKSASGVTSLRVVKGPALGLR
jgi:hypothetical protein